MSVAASDDGVFHNEYRYCADNRDEKAPNVETVHTGGTHEVKEKATDNGTHNSENDVENDPFPSPVHDFASNEPRN